MSHIDSNQQSFIDTVRNRVKFWPVLGTVVLMLGLFSFWQVMDLRANDELQDQKVTALAVALQAEQDNQKAQGDTPVAPPPDQIVDDPGIVKGEQGLPGKDGEDGQDGRDGAKGDKGDPGKPAPTITPTNGVDGKDGVDGTNGTDGTNGVDGKDGTNGTDGKDGADGQPGEPPYSWTVYDKNGKATYTCTRVEEGWDREKPQYKCTPVEDDNPLPLGG